MFETNEINIKIRYKKQVQLSIFLLCFNKQMEPDATAIFTFVTLSTSIKLANHMLRYLERSDHLSLLKYAKSNTSVTNAKFMIVGQITP